MDIKSRRDEILRILGDRDYVTVEEFSKVLGVSAVTIRTDLTVLEEQGQLIRKAEERVKPVLFPTPLLNMKWKRRPLPKGLLPLSGQATP